MGGVPPPNLYLGPPYSGPPRPPLGGPPRPPRNRRFRGGVPELTILGPKNYHFPKKWSSDHFFDDFVTEIVSIFDMKIATQFSVENHRNVRINFREIYSLYEFIYKFYEVINKFSQIRRAPLQWGPSVPLNHELSP